MRYSVGVQPCFCLKTRLKEAMLGKPDVVGEYEKGYVYTSKGGWRNMLMFRFRGGRIQNVFLGPFIE